MNLSDFDFDLPEDRIALHPARPRDAARLLVVSAKPPVLVDRVFRDLADALQPGDCLVFNDTRVIPARLTGLRRRDEAEVAIEALLLKRIDAACWTAFAKPGKRLKPGDRVVFAAADAALGDARLEAEVLVKDAEGIVTFGFDRAGAALDAAIARIGAMPLPPYILDARRRAAEPEVPDDTRDYQTMFAQKEGAVAAPTAALHFTPDVMQALAARGIEHAFVTLHVGAGTFAPVKSETLADHRMHAEWGEVRPEVAAHLASVRARGGRLVAVGTTACRLLETAARGATITPFAGDTDIFIRPGFRFRATDALITNFHLPKSTLLMLVSAFAGVEPMRRAYAHAIEAGYRFYSYGDASLIFPASPSPAEPV